MSEYYWPSVTFEAQDGRRTRVFFDPRKYPSPEVAGASIAVHARKLLGVQHLRVFNWHDGEPTAWRR